MHSVFSMSLLCSCSIEYAKYFIFVPSLKLFSFFLAINTEIRIEIEIPRWILYMWPFLFHSFEIHKNSIFPLDMFCILYFLLDVFLWLNDFNEISSAFWVHLITYASFFGRTHNCEWRSYFVALTAHQSHVWGLIFFILLLLNLNFGWCRCFINYFVQFELMPTIIPLTAGIFAPLFNTFIRLTTLGLTLK